MVKEYAHQSVQIEDNHLDEAQRDMIYDLVYRNLLSTIDMQSVSSNDFATLPLPDVRCPNAEHSQVLELRNHIVASHWIFETAAAPGASTLGLDEDGARTLSALNMRGLDRDGYYPTGWGERVRLGEYRKLPITVRSNPLTIFPYHEEVPACMRRYFQ